MEAKFDVHGVLQIAQSVQHKGTHFYLQAAERFIDPKCSELCRQLATWRTAQKGIEGRSKQQITRKPRDPSTGDKRDYVSTHPSVMADLEALAHSTGRWARLTGRESTDGILRIAILRAEDAIAFYRGLKDFVHDPDFRVLGVEGTGQKDRRLPRAGKEIGRHGEVGADFPEVLFVLEGVNEPLAVPSGQYLFFHLPPPDL